MDIQRVFANVLPDRGEECNTCVMDLGCLQYRLSEGPAHQRKTPCALLPGEYRDEPDQRQRMEQILGTALLAPGTGHDQVFARAEDRAFDPQRDLQPTDNN